MAPATEPLLATPEATLLARLEAEEATEAAEEVAEATASEEVLEK